MAQEFVRNMAVETRSRVVAGVMNAFEQEALPFLPANVRSQVQRAFRARVMASIGQYHDFVLDLISAVPEGVVLSEDAMVLLQEVHAGLARLRSASG